MPKKNGVVMTSLGDIIDLRKRKRAFYISLLNKGLRKLTEREKRLLHNLAMDEDIQLLLRNGDVLE